MRAGLRAAALALLSPLLLSAPAAAWTWLAPPAAPQESESLAGPDLLPEAVTPPSGDSAPAGPGGLCLAAIFEAETRYQIPGHLLLALGLQEAGYRAPEGLTVWPWSVNAEGEGRRFATRAEAIAFVETRQAEGMRSIDLGCLQINLRWHPEAFLSVAEGFDPVVNVDYAARFLRSLYEESGSWELAAGRYHSHSPGPQQVYLTALARNQAVARARLPEFQDQAAASGAAFAWDLPPGSGLPGGPSAAQSRRAARTPGSWHSDGPIWGAAIADDSGARRTLYSALDIEPVLPAFLPPES